MVWSWTNLGQPSTTNIASDPSSVSFGGKQYAFVVGADQQLHVVYGTPWLWSNQGAPSGVKVTGRPSAVSFDGKLYAFVIGDDGALWVRYWNGAWQWVSLGKPAANVSLIGSPGAASSDTLDRLHVFVLGDNEHLYLRYWNGSVWSWRDQGVIGNAIGAPNARWFYDKDDVSRLRAFVPIAGEPVLLGAPNEPSLLENWYEASAGWNIKQHGKPAQPMVKGRVAVNGTFSGAIETWPTWRASAFVKTQNERIYRRLHAPVGSVWIWQWTPGYCQL